MSCPSSNTFVKPADSKIIIMNIIVSDILVSLFIVICIMQTHPENHRELDVTELLLVYFDVWYFRIQFVIDNDENVSYANKYQCGVENIFHINNINTRQLQQTQMTKYNCLNNLQVTNEIMLNSNLKFWTSWKHHPYNKYGLIYQCNNLWFYNIWRLRRGFVTLARRI